MNHARQNSVAGYSVWVRRALGLAVAAGLQAPVHADVLTWNAGGSGAWDTTTPNWNDAGSNPITWDNARNDQAIFSSGGGDITLSGAITASRIDFTGFGYNVTGAQTLTLVDLASIRLADGIDAAISANLVGSAGATFGTTGSLGGTLLLTGNNLALDGPITIAGLKVAVDGNQVNNRFGNNAAIAVNGTGTLEVRGVNALPTGVNAVDVTVAANGLLRFVGGASAATNDTTASHAHLRNLNLNGGVVELGYAGTGTVYNGESFALNGDVTVGGAQPSNINVANGATAAQQGINLVGNRTFTVADVTGSVDADLSVFGELQGAGKLIKAGPGTMTLRARSVHTGNTDVNAGTLRLELPDNTNTGGVRGTVNVATGATLQLASANALGWGAGLKVDTLNVAEGGLVDNIAGGDNGWGIAINLTGGTVRSNNGTSSNNTAQLFSLGGGSSITTFASATSSVIAGRINVRDGNPDNVLPFTVADGAAADDLIVSASFTQNAAPRTLSKNGPGRMVLSGVNGNFNGTVIVNEGQLVFGATNTTGTAANAPAFVINAGGILTNNGNTTHNHIGALTLNGGTLTTGDGTGSYNTENYQFNGDVTVGGTTPSLLSRDPSRTNANSGIALNGPRTFTVNDVTNSPAPDLIVSTELENSDATPDDDGFTKAGAGTMVLATAGNSYQGPTNVTAGKLLVNGTIDNSIAVNVAGGTLGGTGSIASPLTVDLGGKVAPGDGVGELTVSRAVTFGANGAGDLPRLEAELGAPTPTPTSDRLRLTGAGADGVLSLANPDVLDLVALQAITSQTTYTIATVAGSVDGIFNTVLVNGLPTQSVNPALADYVVVNYPAAGQPGDITVTVNNLVPEPASAGLLAAGAAGLLLRRRRSK